ncbi:MAG: NAD(P)-dependent alcohol dehydrogenase [Rhodocyclales bacterium]|nr:NAD(P)-dependent alcohol dehydrogenase [Rhodocyclales bacterium]
MQAWVYERYGPPEVLQLKEVATPVPGAGEVLIRVRATTVSAGDRRLRSLDMPTGFGLIARLLFGVSRPRQPILGSELAGEIAAVGRGVGGFAVGDAVFAYSSAGLGCHAEYVCLPESEVAPKPPNLSDEEAAALSFGGATALDFLRRGKLGRGERVLVNGAAGAVGSAAVQLARHFGATVTGVCGTANLERVRALGAARVIDYTQADFARNGEAYDLIVDTVGTAPFSRCRGALATGGRLLLVAGGLPELLRIPWDSLTSGRKIVAGPASTNAGDLRFLAELAAAGEFRPSIDRVYPFAQMREAHRYVDGGHKRGNVVVTLA